MATGGQSHNDTMSASFGVSSQMFYDYGRVLAIYEKLGAFGQYRFILGDESQIPPISIVYSTAFSGTHTPSCSNHERTGQENIFVPEDGTSISLYKIYYIDR
jgi:hypothetical protein